MGSEWILGRLAWGGGLDSTGSGQGPVAGCDECGDEPSGSCATELVFQPTPPPYYENGVCQCKRRAASYLVQYLVQYSQTGTFLTLPTNCVQKIRAQYSAYY
jgi:hypothetical protein